MNLDERINTLLRIHFRWPGYERGVDADIKQLIRDVLDEVMPISSEYKSQKYDIDENVIISEMKAKLKELGL